MEFCMKSLLVKTLLAGLAIATFAGLGIYFSKRTFTVVPEKVQNISFNCKALTQEESKRLLGKDVVSAGYRPLQITIENKGNDYLKYSPEDISLKTVPAQVVAESVFSNTTGKAVGWGIAGLFLPVLWIPGIVVSARSYEANQKLSKSEQFHVEAVKLLLDRHKIENPIDSKAGIFKNSKIQDLVFVSLKDCQDTFTITLTNQSSQEKVICKADMNNQKFIVS